MSRKPSKTGWWIALSLLVVAGLGATRLGLDGPAFRDLLAAGPTKLAEYLRPSGENLPRLWRSLGETLAMGVFGTILCLLLALPATAFGARNLAPNLVTHTGARQIMNFVRSMPDPLIALILVQGFGLGPLSGALALGIHSSGFVGKTLSERIERLDSRAVEGLRACGASWFQILRFGAWPMIDREIIADGLYILDRNIRTAATLGLVGAGGIGVELMTSLRTFHAADAATAIYMIAGLILIVDSTSSWARAKLL